LVITIQTHDIVASVKKVNSYVALGYDVVERLIGVCDTMVRAQQMCEHEAAGSTVYAAWILYPQQNSSCVSYWVCKLAFIIPDKASAYFVHSDGTPHISVGFNEIIMDGSTMLSHGPVDNNKLITTSNGIVIRLQCTLPDFDDGYATIVQSMTRLQVCTGQGHKYPGNLAPADFGAPDLYGWLRWYRGRLSFGTAHLADSFYYERTPAGGITLVDKTKNIKKVAGKSISTYDAATSTYSWLGCGSDMLYSVPRILNYYLNVTAIEIPVVSTAGYASNLTVFDHQNGTITASFGVTDGSFLVTYTGNGVSISLEYLLVSAGYIVHSYQVDFLGTLCVESTTSVCYTILVEPTAATTISSGLNTDVGSNNSTISNVNGLGMTISLAISVFGCFVVAIVSLVLTAGCRSISQGKSYTKVVDE